MAYYGFATAIVAGNRSRSTTAAGCSGISPISTTLWPGVVGCLERPPTGMPAPRLLNIGNHRSEAVNRLIELLEQALGQRAVLHDAPRPAADVAETFAAVEAIATLTGFAPTVSLEEGIPRFVAWFKDWHGIGGAKAEIVA